MVMPVTTVHELLADAQLGERQMFHPVETAVGSLRLPRAPAVFSRTPVPPPALAPALGEHDGAVAREWLPPPSMAAAGIGRRRLPLEGLRVADFSWMLAAPIATRILGDLGADVIRIESHTRRDMTREIGPQPPGTFSLDTNSTQHHASSNKRSIALDLHHPEAVALAREIISRSDVVFENFSPGTMARWGLDPHHLLDEWPGLVVVSQPAVGATGPARRWGAIGNGVAGYGGINLLTGFPENLPVGVGPIVADFAAPLFSTTALLAALHERRRTGRGQYVDCGMLEATLWLLDVAFAEAQLTGRNPPRTGNRSAWMAPHGVFRCAGDDEWIAIAVRDDADWARAAAALGQPALAHDPRFRTLAARKQHEDELEALLGALAGCRDRWELAAALQRAGVPAGPVEHVADHLERDAGMSRRFTAIGHPYGYEFLVQAQFIRPWGEVVPNRRAPMIGEHSQEILRDLLGMSQEAIAGLVVKGILN
jgi:benzylsuccinate CoA-transferase BbsF subunit